MKPRAITDRETLREGYAPPIERVRLKILRKLDRHCRSFIARSPFLCLGTSSDEGGDVTPRGDRPGFVQVLDDVTIAIPDWPGNNRLDSLTNILANPRVGILFMIPGVDETLRVNGEAAITKDSEILALWEADGKRPKAALVVTIRETYLHCGKALIRARLWREDYKIDRGELPPYGQMLKDQMEIGQTAEEIEASVQEGYKKKLY